MKYRVAVINSADTAGITAVCNNCSGVIAVFDLRHSHGTLRFRKACNTSARAGSGYVNTGNTVFNCEISHGAESVCNNTALCASPVSAILHYNTGNTEIFNNSAISGALEQTDRKSL